MSSASSSTTTLSEQRPEADPLPRKVGELGYVAPMSPKTPEGMHPDSTAATQEQSTMPARHPADRDHDDVPPTSSGSTQPPAAVATDTNTPATANANSGSSIKKRWSLGGVSPVTLLRSILLLLFLAGTIVAWVVTVTRFKNTDAFDDATSSASGSGGGGDNSSGGNQNNNGGMPVFTSMVIVHVSFTVVILVELLFLERSIYHARAERYLYKHGMPRGANGASAFIGIAPWNRPPLPTYAAALAESGVGTGDVEDNLIAIAPPPAYGNTRGSVLLLSGHLRDSLTRALNRNSRGQQSQDAQAVTPREMEEGQRSRPISYEASQEVDDALRARQLEETLSTLEHHPGRTGV